MIQAYNKLIVALVAALAIAGVLIADGNLNSADWIAIVASFVGALGVYAVPNKPPTS